MAKPTTDPNVKIGDKIQSQNRILVISKIKKHSYDVILEDGTLFESIWSWELKRDRFNNLVYEASPKKSLLEG